jgi:hypothetical protein
MKHFQDEEWLDYVRGLSPPGRREAMEQSLSEGCKYCLKLFNFWRTTVEVGVRESQYHVPDEAVEMAAATYAAWSRSYRLRATARSSRLVFDSSLRLAVAGFRGFEAGFRGPEAGSRRLVKRSGRWIIDLRLENEGNDRVSMAGQVLQSGEWTGAPRAKEVCVMYGEELLARTEANQFSEFQLQFPVARNLKLYVEIEGERPILVNLPETNPSGSASSAPDDE